MNIEELIKPITANNPIGENLAYDVVFDQIEEAKRYDDIRLPQGDWVKEPKKAEWIKVKQICIDTLQNKSKDLQIAAHLTECLLVQEGIPGLINGLKLMQRIHEKYDIKDVRSWIWITVNISQRFCAQKITLKPIIYTLNSWLTKDTPDPLAPTNKLNEAIKETGLDFYKQLDEQVKELDQVWEDWFNYAKKIYADISDEDFQQVYKSFKELVKTGIEMNQPKEIIRSPEVVETENIEAPRVASIKEMVKNIDNKDSREMRKMIYENLQTVHSMMKIHEPQNLSTDLLGAALKFYNLKFEDIIKILDQSEINTSQLLKFLLISKV